MTLIAIGGYEDKTNDMTIWHRILAEAKGASSRVTIITTASNVPEERKQEYSALMARLGVSDFSIRYIGSRPEAGQEAVLADVSKADIVFMTGGDQLKITSMLGNTSMMDIVDARYAAGMLVVAGSSAGAAAAASLMVYGGDPQKAMQRDEVSMTSGLNFLPASYIETHLETQKRLPRIFNALAMSPHILGVGLSDDTAIVYKGGDTLEVIGSGTATFVNARTMTETTVTEVGKGEVFTTKGIESKTLAAGAVYSISNRKTVLTPA